MKICSKKAKQNATKKKGKKSPTGVEARTYNM